MGNSQFKVKGLRICGGSALVQVPESKSLGIWSSDIQEQVKNDAVFWKKKVGVGVENFYFFYLFVPSSLPAYWMVTAHIESETSPLTPQTHMTSLLWEILTDTPGKTQSS
jgi:hypothetical protein